MDFYSDKFTVRNARHFASIRRLVRGTTHDDLHPSYFKQAVRNLVGAVEEKNRLSEKSLFDLADSA
jgi:hypothetical protein